MTEQRKATEYNLLEGASVEEKENQRKKIIHEMIDLFTLMGPLLLTLPI